MAKPTRKGTSAWYQGTSASDFWINSRMPTDIADGDLLFLHITFISTTATLTDAASKGWQLLKEQTIGSRKMQTWVRKYLASEESERQHHLTKSGPVSMVYALEVVGTHGAQALATDFILGNGWVRPAAGSTVQMPSINTPSPDYLVLGVASEATNAVGGMPTLTTPSGFTHWFSRPETDGVSIEQINTYYKEMPTSGATGTPILDYGSAVATTSNGGGYQIGIPPLADSSSVVTGQVQAYGAFRPSATEIVVGTKKLAATGAVEAVLYAVDGTTELARVTINHDNVTKWGSARFAGLFPSTDYVVKFRVNGTEQTDAILHPKTLPAAGTPVSFKFITGSCQFTGSNHPVFDRIREEKPTFLAHMGDLHYVDATEDVAWRAGMESSLTASKMKQLLDTIPMSWSMDNHDRIMTNPGGAGTALNLGETDPKTAAQWKHLAGTHEWASPDGLGQAWQVGRVLFVSADLWSARDDPDFDPEPRTFMGSVQKAWFKDLLSKSTATLIIWFSQWTNRNNANGRWNSFPTETAELEAWFNDNPTIKRKMIMIGGDSHSPQAGDGDYGGVSGYRFLGIPSLNFSGFNRSGDAGDGSTGWNIINEGGRPSGSAEADYGLYSRINITDDGTHLRFQWFGKKVDAAGVVTSRAYFERSYGQDWDKLWVGSTLADRAYLGEQLVWVKDAKGLDPQFDIQV